MRDIQKRSYIFYTPCARLKFTFLDPLTDVLRWAKCIVLANEIKERGDWKWGAMFRRVWPDHYKQPSIARHDGNVHQSTPDHQWRGSLHRATVQDAGDPRPLLNPFRQPRWVTKGGPAIFDFGQCPGLGADERRRALSRIYCDENGN